MENFNPVFLKKKYNTLHTSPEVASAARRSEIRSVEKVSQKSEDQIENYLDRFSEILDRPDPKRRQQGIKALKKVLHKELLIKPENIPFDYFLNQEQGILEREGRGRPEATEDWKERKIKEVLRGQEHSLNVWIDYLSSPNAMYPDWAKYWAFRSMTEMGGYNKEQRKFSKRNETSSQPFPTLNIACMAKTIDLVQRHVAITGLPKNNPERQKREKELSYALNHDSEYKDLLSSENFAKIYTHALEKFSGMSWDSLENIAGQWKTYKQGSAPDELYQSLQGYPLEWCTATNIETAEVQLNLGDFHVYYSLDKNGAAIIPRLAIRMEENRFNNDYDDEPNDTDNNGEYDEDKFFITDPIKSQHTVFENLTLEQINTLGLHDENNSAPIGNNYVFLDTHSISIDKNQKIVEIRGIESNQNIDQFIQPILDETLDEFGEEAESYLKKSEDMKRMTEITTRYRTGGDLSLEDLRFVYQINYPIEGFGYQPDPRIKEITDSRKNTFQDFRMMFECQDLDDETFIDKLIKDKQLSFLTEHLSSFKNIDHTVIAHKIIESGEGKFIINYISSFEIHNQSEIVYKLIESGYGESVIKNFSSFEGIQQLDVANTLISIGEVNIVVRNLSSFDKDNRLKILDTFIESGEMITIVENISTFKNLNKSLAYKMIETGYGESVIKNFSSFEETQQLDVAHKFIKCGQLDNVFQILPFLDESSCFEIFNTLIKNKKGWDVAKNIFLFKGLDHNYAVDKLFESEDTYAVIDNISLFKGIDYNDVARKILASRHGYLLAGKLSFFQELDLRTALKLIEKGEYFPISENISSFKEIYHKDIANELINERGYALIKNLSSFKGIDHIDIAEKLIKAGAGRHVPEYILSFEGIDHTDTANKLIEAGAGYSVARYLSSFKGIDQTDIACKLIADGKGDSVVDYISLFNEINRGDIAHKIIEAGGLLAVARSIYKFNALDPNDILYKVIQAGKGEFLGDFGNQKNFDGLSIINKLIENGEEQHMIENLRFFKGVDLRVIAHKLIEAGKAEFVAKNINNFSWHAYDVENQIKEARDKIK
jgi:hypothetical protein